ncbi:MAG: hypothetical protein OXT69_12015 [Candidatus Poribacteria bacterium]|nr:hypothetical protein [Candidatus Poribacteria bacterium]
MQRTMLCAAVLWIAAATVLPAATPVVEWLFNDNDNLGNDSSQEGKVHATAHGADWTATPIDGGALLDGKSGYLRAPDSALINTTGPFPKRTVVAVFKVDDARISTRKQVVFEEGGRTRGAVIYVFDGEVYVGAWNRAEYHWQGEWISAGIQSNRWYHVALLIRDAKGAVEDDKFEMWLDGSLVEKRPGGQLHAHGDDTGIGAVVQNVFFHDEGGSGTLTDHFGGVIEELRIYNESLTRAEMEDDARSFLSVESRGKVAVRWGVLKTD